MMRVFFAINRVWLFLISNFRHVLNVVRSLPANSPASEFYMPTFQNTLPVPSSWAGRYGYSSYLPAREDGTEFSETLAYKIRTPGNWPEESIQEDVVGFNFCDNELLVRGMWEYSQFSTCSCRNS
jgi:hypothetical protein